MAKEKTLNELSPELLQRAGDVANQQGRQIQGNKFQAASRGQIQKQQADAEAQKTAPLKPFFGQVVVFYLNNEKKGIFEVPSTIVNISFSSDAMSRTPEESLNIYFNSMKPSFVYNKTKDSYITPPTNNGTIFVGLDQKGAQLLWKIAKTANPESRITPNTLFGQGTSTPIAGKTFRMPQSQQQPQQGQQPQQQTMNELRVIVRKELLKERFMFPVKARIVIMSHLSDLQEDAHDIFKLRDRVNFIKFLVMKYPDTNTEINPDEEFEEFKIKHGNNGPTR